jgi:hypothetical protein
MWANQGRSRGEEVGVDVCHIPGRAREGAALGDDVDGGSGDILRLEKG